MRKSQLLYISAVTICLLGNGMSAAGSRHRSQAEPALQSRWPATVAGSRSLLFLASLPISQAPAHKVNGAFFFYLPRGGVTLETRSGRGMAPVTGIWRNAA